jgi:hypothetical protein
VFENRELKRIYGPTKDEVKGGWRNCTIRSFETWYSSPSIISLMKSKMKWVGHVAQMGQKRNVYRYRPICRWVNNIKMDLGQTGWVMIGLVWLRIGTSGEHLRMR